MYRVASARDGMEKRTMSTAESAIAIETIYSSLLESIPASILLIDRGLRVVSANKNFLEKSRRNKSAVIMNRIDAVFPRVLLSYTDLERKITAVFQSATPLEGGKMTYRAPGLPTRVYFYSLTPMIAPEGDVTHVILFMDDITERERLGEEVRRAERHLASVVESITDILVSMDAEGNIRTWNSAAEQISGLKDCEVRGRALASLVSNEFRGKMDEVLKKVSKGQTLRDVQMNLASKEGREIPISWSCSPMRDERGAITGMVGAGRDLSERRQLQAQLIQSAKMAALGVMAGGIAHEIRNPLGIIFSAAQLLMERKGDRQIQEESARKIFANVIRASKTIENLLRFARPPEDQMGPVNIVDALEESLSLFANQFKVQRIKVKYRWDRPLPIVQGNKNLLQQVFLNIMLNASRFMQEGGEFRVYANHERAEYIRIIFEDTGCGIPPQDLPKIFDPFFTTMPVGRGSGLGLSISYSIIKQHRGDIRVDSEVGSGTTVTILIPTGHNNRGGRSS